MKIRALLLAAVFAASPAFAVLKSAGGTSGGGGGSGTVTSVGVTMPSVFTVTGSPVTTAGTIGVTFATGQSGNLVLASPDGATGAISLRALTFSDLPAGLATLNSFNIFTVGQEISDAEPQFLYNETDQGTDLKLWDWDVQAGVFSGRTRTDAAGAGQNWLTVTRGATTAISNIALGNTTNNPTFTWLGTGTATFGGGATFGNASSVPNTSFFSGGALRVTGSSVSNAATGIYLPATNTLGFSTAATARGSFDANGMFNILNTEPRQTFDETDQGTDLKNWDWDVQAGVLSGRTRTDADAAGKNWLAVTRGTTTAISNVAFGNATDNNTFSFLGTGLATFSGAISAATYNATGTTRPGNGVYIVNALTLGLAAGGASSASLTQNGLLSTGAYTSGQTKFTTTGCSVSATTGGASAGTFTLGANTCSVVVTINGATGVIAAANGWHCTATDRTAQAAGTASVVSGEASSTTTTATFVIPVAVGATDVFSFSCIGF